MRERLGGAFQPFDGHNVAIEQRKRGRLRAFLLAYDGGCERHLSPKDRNEHGRQHRSDDQQGKLITHNANSLTRTTGITCLIIVNRRLSGSLYRPSVRAPSVHLARKVMDEVAALAQMHRHEQSR
jgi:hypothetical protein